MSTPSDRPQPAASANDFAADLQAAVGDRYRIDGKLGEGGMATVFLAEDLKHHRKVAIKVLQEGLTQTIGIRRFLLEIEVVAQLQHPHLLTLYDSGDVNGVPYYVMPYVDGQSLRDLIARERRIPVERAVAIAREVADGLHYAHQHGVLHRDIKPSNILMSASHAMIADFGIATALQKAAVDRLTETGVSVGSPTYMSPEQASGERDLDARTDIYSVSCVLYEMLCGAPPIDGASAQQVVTRKVTGQFVPLRERCPQAPPALEAAVHKGLATDRDARFTSAQEFGDAITRAIRGASGSSRRTKNTVWAGAVTALLVLVGAGAWLRHERRAVWAARQVGEIKRLTAGGEFASAFQLADQVAGANPRDSTLLTLRPQFADFVRIVTAPAGARVYRRRIDDRDDEWEPIGTTPLDSVPMPKYGKELMYQLRIERDGYRAVELLPHVFANWTAFYGVAALDTLRLDPRASAEEGMVRIPGWTMRDTLHPAAGTIRFADYRIGRTEVTNRKYQRFVAAGGYERREYWAEPFVRDGRAISWDEAMREFRDRTGLPGPSTWSGGSFPPGQEEFPVGGVSYYEAAAYARFAGTRLPTSAHWRRAALLHSRLASWIYLPASNLNSTAARPVGRGIINEFGLYDVVGNVREWCLNPLESGRLTRGAGWEDSEFFADHLIPKSDFDRSPSNGFRLVAVTDDDTTLAHLSGRIERQAPRDYRNVTPISDAEFAIYRRLFEYDELPLNARLDTSGVGEHYRWEKVSFTAAYGHERMSAYIFLPKDARPPYPAVMYWPHTGVIVQRASDPKGFVHSFESYLGFIPRSGRALVLPVFKGTFYRSDSTLRVVMELPDSTTYARDLTIQRIKDLRRTVDLLQTRSDIAPGQFGFFGWSWGGGIAPIVLAVEPRIRAAVLHVGGLYPTGVFRPEIDAVNYLPRARVPTLMLNGRYDVVFPYESSQLPFVRMLGTPPADKKHVVYPSSHTVPQADVVRETLTWFDKYLPPPTRQGRR